MNDISGHWAEASIKQSLSGGIVTGYADGSFRPDAPITSC
ncbi:S-layer homology domain-containing protein [Paenibacillus sp. GCM10012307]|uniref:S-layer homology domain-containing protein n=1 Tax=Paenibacillus roseus TaxID=2798579 RepID=A0A934MPW6_9BACL|nr:S-layer homology domain-containing protein [Paenibacillus roseus]